MQYRLALDSGPECQRVLADESTKPQVFKYSVHSSWPYKKVADWPRLRVLCADVGAPVSKSKDMGTPIPHDTIVLKSMWEAYYTAMGPVAVSNSSCFFCGSVAVSDKGESAFTCCM
eukprot:6536933-Pyramimonas_sp.AAC.1